MFTWEERGLCLYEPGIWVSPYDFLPILRQKVLLFPWCPIQPPAKSYKNVWSCQITVSRQASSSWFSLFLSDTATSPPPSVVGGPSGLPVCSMAYPFFLCRHTKTTSEWRLSIHAEAIYAYVSNVSECKDWRAREYLLVDRCEFQDGKDLNKYGDYVLNGSLMTP